MRQFCSHCEKWFTTEKHNCPKCGGILKSEDDCEKFDNNISRYSQTLPNPTSVSRVQEITDINNNEKQNDTEDSTLSVLLSIDKKLGTINKNLDFITTVVIIGLVLVGIFVLSSIINICST